MWDKAFKIASDPKYQGYQRRSASIVYKFFDKKSSGSGVAAIEPNYQVANELHKQIIRIFKRRKVYHLLGTIWGVDLADMQSLSKYNKGIKYLLCEIDLFSKYAWVVPLKHKRGISVINAFQKIISKERKPNKIWVDQDCEFYNNLFKKFLKINNIIVCMPPPFLQGGRAVESLTRFSKRGGLDRTSPFRGGCWERGGDFNQAEAAIFT